MRLLENPQVTRLEALRVVSELESLSLLLLLSTIESVTNEMRHKSNDEPRQEEFRADIREGICSSQRSGKAPPEPNSPSQKRLLTEPCSKTESTSRLATEQKENLAPRSASRQNSKRQVCDDKDAQLRWQIRRGGSQKNCRHIQDNCYPGGVVALPPDAVED